MERHEHAQAHPLEPNYHAHRHVLSKILIFKPIVPPAHDLTIADEATNKGDREEGGYDCIRASFSLQSILNSSILPHLSFNRFPGLLK